MNYRNLAIGSALTILIVAVLPFVLERFGWGPSLNRAAGYVLVITAIGLLVKSVIGEIASKEFQWSRFGYDYCTIGFGGILSALALQLTSPEKDLFPGMNYVVGIKDTPPLSTDAATRTMQLSLAILIALIFTIVSAGIAAELKKGDNPLLSLVSAIFGTTLLGSYVLILIAKG